MFNLFKKQPQPETPSAPTAQPEASIPNALRNRRSVELKIKSMSLACEAKIIRREESRLKERQKRDGSLIAIRERIYWHRVQDVRWEARDTFIARAFLAGIPYTCVEFARYDAPEWTRVAAMIKKYGSGTTAELERFERWKAEGDAEVVSLTRGAKKKVRKPKTEPTVTSAVL